MGILGHLLPDRTAAGRTVAEARSLEAVGARLRAIYQREQILEPRRFPLPEAKAGSGRKKHRVYQAKP